MTSCLEGLPYKNIVSSNVPRFGDGHAKIIDKTDCTATNACNLTSAISKEVSNIFQLPVAAVVWPLFLLIKSPISSHQAATSSA